MRFFRKVFLCLVAATLLAEGLLQAGHAAVSAWREVRWHREQQASASADFVVLCVGESTTEWGGAHAYPAILQRVLQAALPQKKVQVVNGGRAAFDSARLHAALPKMLEDIKPQVVVFMMGINDPLFLPLPNAHESLWEKWFSWSRLWKLAEIARAHFGGVNQSSSTSSGLMIVNFPAHPPDSPAVEALFEKGKAAVIAGNLAEARQTFAEFLERAPRAFNHYRVGEAFYMQDGKGAYRETAASYLEKAYALDPQLPQVQWLLGTYLSSIPKDSTRAKQILESALSQPTISADIYVALAEVYRKEGNAEGANNLLAGSLLKARGSSRLFIYEQLLEECAKTPNAPGFACEQWKQDAVQEFPGNLLLLAKADKEKAVLTNVQNYASHPGTIREYRAMAEEAQQSGAAVIAMQYPTMELKPLQEMLSGLRGLKFVENRAAFMGHRYEELFTDKFAGSFGHTTALGSEKIAEPLAKVILGMMGSHE